MTGIQRKWLTWNCVMVFVLCLGAGLSPRAVRASLDAKFAGDPKLAGFDLCPKGLVKTWVNYSASAMQNVLFYQRKVREFRELGSLKNLNPERRQQGMLELVRFAQEQLESQSQFVDWIPGCESGQAYQLLEQIKNKVLSRDYSSASKDAQAIEKALAELVQ